MKKLIVAFMLLITAVQSAVAANDSGSAPAADTREIHAAAPLIMFNRTITTFRAPFMGIPAKERAERAKGILERMLVKGGAGAVTLQEVPQGYAVMVDGVMAFFIVHDDADPLIQETLPQAAHQAVANLERLVRETAEAQNLSAVLRAAGLALAAGGLLLLFVWLLYRIRNLIVNRLAKIANRYSEKLLIGGESLIHGDRILAMVSRSISLIYWSLTLLLVFNWVVYVLARFPYTRAWGEQLHQYLLNIVKGFGSSIIYAIPGIMVSLLIFSAAKLLINLLKNIFDRIDKGGFQIAGLDHDTIRPTRRLIATGIWLFAIAMAYPYLPGSQTEAFKGLSLLVGLMVSLGGSSLVGQAASGLILMYTRTMRPGEFVQIAGSEGTVMELGLFTTRVRTGLGEDLTLPNALILANITRNYSRSVQGPGYILDTTVTIGYDTAWRQVHAMLIEAALRTTGVLPVPSPQVFQTALSDFYPQYRLVCQAIPAEPSSRAEVMNALHANIQDVFNEYGVQIMSPHYLGDPAHPKWVPQDKWRPPPATKAP